MKAASVFEHQRVHVGDSLRMTDGAERRFESGHFDALAAYNDRGRTRFFEVGHRRVTFSQYVGLLQIGDLAIEVLPKADREPEGAATAARWQRALLRMLRVAWGIPLVDAGTAAQRTGPNALLELVVGRFVEAVEALLHEGLARGYRGHESNETALRGGLLFAEHIRHNTVRADRFYVRSQVYDHDTPHHRVLAAALRVASETPLPPRLRARVDAVRDVFPIPPPVRLAPDACERLSFTRATERYRGAVALAGLLLAHHAPELRGGQRAVFALLFDMNAVWEGYVAALVRRVCSRDERLAVLAQRRHAFWRSETGAPDTAKPDLVVCRRNTGAAVLVLDAKWKLLDDGTPSSADLRQMFSYAEILNVPRAALVYPRASGGRAHTRGAYAGRETRCDIVSIEPPSADSFSIENAVQQASTVLTMCAPEIAAG